MIDRLKSLAAKNERGHIISMITTVIMYLQNISDDSANRLLKQNRISGVFINEKYL